LFMSQKVRWHALDKNIFPRNVTIGFQKVSGIIWWD